MAFNSEDVVAAGLMRLIYVPDSYCKLVHRARISENDFGYVADGSIFRRLFLSEHRSSWYRVWLKKLLWQDYGDRQCL